MPVGNNIRSRLTLAFVPILLFSLGMISYNAFADQTIATIPVNGVKDVAANSNTNMVYVANGNTYRIQVINGTTNTVTANVTTAYAPSDGLGCYTDTVAVNPKTNIIYV
ncbi:MAG: hypothetical protein ACREBI_12145 [Nitrosotalea sp.]